MDRKIILNNINIYQELEREQKKVKAIELGLNFLDNFYSQLDELQLLSLKEFPLDLETIKIYNYKEKKFKKVNVNIKLFQSNLQFCYRKFRAEEYFIIFPWYKKFYLNVVNTFQIEFGYDSKTAIDFMVVLVSECFIFFSSGLNQYNYNDMENHLIKLFTALSLEKDICKEYSKTILKNLVKSKLLIYESSFNLFNKKLSLSDCFMDTVFHLNSMLIPRLSSDNTDIKYNSNFQLKNISKIIENYDNNWKNKYLVNKLDKIFYDKYPDLIKDLSDYYILDLDFINLKAKGIPDHVLDSSRAYYFNKILLNEYFMQLIIMSCFDSFFLNENLKNVLYDYRDFFKQ